MLEYVELNRAHDDGEISDDKYELLLAKVEYDLESAQVILTTNGEFVLFGVEIAGQLTALKVSLRATAATGEVEIAAGEAVDLVPGRVKSRINIADGPTETTPYRLTGEKVSAGFDHVLDDHFYRPAANSRSIFSITPEELKVILQSETVVSSPVTAIGNGVFVRTVNAGTVVGKTAKKYGELPTSSIKVFTDRAGNLITTYPVP